MTESLKLWTGYVLGGVIFFVCLVLAYSSEKGPTVPLLLCLLGGAAGWTTGIMVTPLNEDEKTRFSGITKGFLALGSGFVIGKLEDSLVEATKKMISNEGEVLALLVLLFLVCLVVGFLFTLVTRLYGEKEVVRRQKNVARLLAQADEIAEKLKKARQA